MSDAPISEPLRDNSDDQDTSLTADEVMEGGHVAPNMGAEVQGMGVISGAGSGAGASEVEPADDYPPDNDGETVD